MALKAGRVGVAPDQVDDFGKVKSEATSGYTKQEADAKFETQTAASEALALKQPKTLEVPIEMSGDSKLTVEDALQGLADVVTPDKTAFGSVKGTASVNTIVKTGNIVVADLRTKGVTTEAWESIVTIPTGYRPANNVWFIATDMTAGALIRCSLNSDGSVNCPSAITNKEIYIHAFWSIV